MPLLLNLGYKVLCVCVTHISVISSTADINRTNWSGHTEEHRINDELPARWTSATVLTSREPKARDWSAYVESAKLISITCYHSRSSANWTSSVRGPVRTTESLCNCLYLVTSSYFQVWISYLIHLAFVVIILKRKLIFSTSVCFHCWDMVVEPEFNSTNLLLVYAHEY